LIIYCYILLIKAYLYKKITPGRLRTISSSFFFLQSTFLFLIEGSNKDAGVSCRDIGNWAWDGDTCQGSGLSESITMLDLYYHDWGTFYWIHFLNWIKIERY
jgi:hypothetical protein